MLDHDTRRVIACSTSLNAFASRQGVPIARQAKWTASTHSTWTELEREHHQQEARKSATSILPIETAGTVLVVSW